MSDNRERDSYDIALRIVETMRLELADMLQAMFTNPSYPNIKRLDVLKYISALVDIEIERCEIDPREYD